MSFEGTTNLLKHGFWMKYLLKYLLSVKYQQNKHSGIGSKNISLENILVLY